MGKGRSLCLGVGQGNSVHGQHCEETGVASRLLSLSGRGPLIVEGTVGCVAVARSLLYLGHEF